MSCSRGGWRPVRALSYSAFCHPEVVATNLSEFKKNTAVTTLDTTITPYELNLSEGLVGTMINKIFVYKTKEADNFGVNMVERMRT